MTKLTRSIYIPPSFESVQSERRSRSGRVVWSTPVMGYALLGSRVSPKGAQIQSCVGWVGRLCTGGGGAGSARRRSRQFAAPDSRLKSRALSLSPAATTVRRLAAESLLAFTAARENPTYAWHWHCTGPAAFCRSRNVQGRDRDFRPSGRCAPRDRATKWGTTKK